MSKSFLKELPTLIKEGLIDEATANKIKDYYESKTKSSTNRLVIAFGILGGLLVGLGIILIVAHNWDTLPKNVKLVFAFLPLLLGQILAVTIVVKKYNSIALREGTGAFLLLAVGASISLVSQIYNINGSLSDFLLIWTALSIPVIYVLNSSLASLLVWVGATLYACYFGYFNSSSQPAFYYLALIIFALPHYIMLVKDKMDSNFATFHHWAVSLSLLISFGTLCPDRYALVAPGYASLLGVFILIAQSKRFADLRLASNAYHIFGSLGTVFMLLGASALRSINYFEGDFDKSGFTVLVFLAGLGLLVQLARTKKLASLNPASFVFILFLPFYMVGFSSPILAQILFNLVLMALALVIMLEGARKNHLGLLNYGLLILTLQIIYRFFDVEISFLLRGVIFILVGLGFFAGNYWILKKNKAN